MLILLGKQILAFPQIIVFKTSHVFLAIKLAKKKNHFDV